MYNANAPRSSSNAGGTDPDAVVAWMVALNLTTDYLPDFSGLLDFDLLSRLICDERLENTC